MANQRSLKDTEFESLRLKPQCPDAKANVYEAEAKMLATRPVTSVLYHKSCLLFCTITGTTCTYKNNKPKMRTHT